MITALWKRYIAMFVLCLMLGNLTGCPSTPLTPRQQFAAVQDEFIAATEILTQARLDGVFDDKEWSNVIKVLKDGDEALDLLEIATREGGEPDQIHFAAQLRKILNLLRPFIVKAKGGGA